MRVLVPFILVVAVAAAKAQTPVEDKFFDSNGVRIRYVEAGRGTPVLLFHAMSESIETWQRAGVIDAFARDFRVIAFDSRGHGASDKPRDPTGYGRAMVDDAARLLDHLQIPAAHIAGYSMGGYVAARFAGSHPARALTLTLGGSSVMSPWLWKSRFAALVREAAPALERGDPRPLLGRLASGAELEERVRDLLARNDPLALAAAVRSFDAMILTSEEIERLPMPVLVVTGSEDLPQERRDAFEGHVRAVRFVDIEGGTHGGPRGTLRRPEFAATVRDFLLTHRNGR